jgi:hypothetical protein
LSQIRLTLALTFIAKSGTLSRGVGTKTAPAAQMAVNA